MPTEDYSNTSRTAKLRQWSSLKGLNKVARALDYDTQLSVNLGGIREKHKNLSRSSYNCGLCPAKNCTNCKSTVASCSGTFPANPGSTFTANSICNGTTCVYTGSNVTYPQINAIPGTSTGNMSGSLVIVNCTPNTVFFTVHYASSTLNGQIAAGSSALTGSGSDIVSYSFS